MKNNKGFTLIELSISILAVVLFSTIVANVNYAIFTNSVDAKKTAIATEKTVEVLEYIGTINIEDYFDEYGNLENTIIEKIENEKEEYTNPSMENNTISFKIENENYACLVTFDDYANGENEAQVNILKIVTVTITYNVGKNSETVSIQRLLT